MLVFIHKAVALSILGSSIRMEVQPLQAIRGVAEMQACGGLGVVGLGVVYVEEGGLLLEVMGLLFHAGVDGTGLMGSGGYGSLSVGVGVRRPSRRFGPGDGQGRGCPGRP